MEEVFDLCFSDDNFELASKAFVLFSQLKPEIVDAQYFNYMLLSKGSAIFYNKNISNVVLSRLSSLILYSTRNFPIFCRETCGLIIQLLQYVYANGVIEMFVQMCDYNSKMTDVQEMLLDAEFSKCVIAILNKKSDERILENLIKIVRMSCGNNILMKTFKTPDMANEIIKFVNHTDHYVKTQLWRCLTALICEENIDVLKAILPNAISIISEPFKKVDMYRVFAFDFLGKFLKYDNSISEYYDEEHVLEQSVRHMIDFKDSTNLLSSVFRLIINCLDSPLLCDIVLTSLVPSMMLMCKTDERNATKSFCLTFITELSTKSQRNKKMRQTLESLPGYKDFCKQILYPYNELLFAKYGGSFERRTTRKPSTVLLPD